MISPDAPLFPPLPDSSSWHYRLWSGAIERESFSDSIEVMTNAFRETLRELYSTSPRPSAKDLTESQKSALLWVAGELEFRDGKFSSRRPVTFADRGDGGYIIGIGPSRR